MYMEAIQLNIFVRYTYYKHFKWAKKMKGFDIAVTREHKNENKTMKPKAYCK